MNEGKQTGTPVAAYRRFLSGGGGRSNLTASSKSVDAVNLVAAS